ncbi:MAG: CapA family protein [Lachnospiraceae bacterium]|nr:CapA family protein [Lachnospiraceae bacterium]
MKDNDRRVIIRNNHKDYKKSRKRKTALAWTIVILLVAGLVAGGIYFRADEKIMDIYESFTSESEDAELSKAEDETKTTDSEETTADSVNEKDSAVTSDTSLSEDTTVVFTGDIELSTYAQRNYDASGIDGLVSEPLQSQLRDADILEVNNEFCFSTRGTQAADKQYTFRVDPSYVTALTDLGVDVAGLANNHVLDYGQEALSDTFTTLTDAGIEYTGAGDSVEDASKLVTIEKNGKTFGFLAASRVIPVASWNVENSQPGVFTCYDTTALCNAITAAKSQVDYLFVCVHWGTEHTDTLTDYQQPNAHAYIEAGADAVIGAHSHCLQEIEYYNGKPIFYSLGNFIFNETIDSTMAVKFTISDSDEIEVSLLPASASSCTTSLAEGEKATSIYNYLMSISDGVTIDENGVVTEKSE